MRWIVIATASLVAAGLTACDDGQESTMDGDARATAQAAAEYDEEIFDTVAWASDSAAVNRGRDIYTWVCAECHGESGLGDAGRVVDGDTLRPPSFQAEDWGFADDPEALWQRIYVGTTLGMPHWGVRRMQPRDIVAVERYIRLELIQD